VNADTLAGHLAGALRAERLLIAGGTAGVLDKDGATLDALAVEAVDAMTASGHAHSGMVAKLAACRTAIERGVNDVRIITGRAVTDFDHAMGTRVISTVAAASVPDARPDRRDCGTQQ
jgi:acetylglutamate kinase